MTVAVSNCKEQCIHYWVCKNREQYEKIIQKTPEVNVEGYPDYIEGVQSISLICKEQIQPQYGNNCPKYMRFNNCLSCIHGNICKHKIDYEQICESLKESKIPLTVHCPHYKSK